jgi:hypothetical protein
MIITNPISSLWCGGFESHKEMQTHQVFFLGVICSTALNEIWTHHHKGSRIFCHNYMKNP